MSDLTNLSFEVVAGDGVSAASWTTTVTSSADEIDDFTGPTAEEGFEFDWGTTLETTLTPSNSTPLQFTNPIGVIPTFADGFEFGWANNAWTSEVLGEADLFDSGTFPFDGFEGWSLLETFFGSYEADSFESGFGFDGFEFEWQNTNYELLISYPANAEILLFDGARANAFESFEFLQTDVAIASVDTSTGRITLVSDSAFADGYSAQVYASTGSLPAGYVPATTYTVVSVLDSGSEFVLGLNGVNQVPSTGPIGLSYVTDPFEFWTVSLSI